MAHSDDQEARNEIVDGPSSQGDLIEAHPRPELTNERYEKLFDLAPGGYLETDLRSVIKLANVASANLLGYGQEALIDTPLSRYIAEGSRDRFLARVSGLREGDAATEWEVRMLTADGVHMDVSLAVLRGRDGWEGTEERRVLRWFLHDITARKEREDRVAYLAFHDELTGLPSRRMLGEFLHLALARARRSRLGVAVLCIVVDDFKAINDSLGRGAGDQLLREVARRLDTARRASDMVARFGGGEFMMLLADLHMPEQMAAQVALPEAELASKRIQQAIELPFVLNGIEVHTTMSVAISSYPGDADDGRALIAKAEAAMYLQKARGRRRSLLVLRPAQRTLLSQGPETPGAAAAGSSARADSIDSHG
jgi:diguanylate cyclase (GGDEF)-like protein/PAS domain S-box-containing protein